MVDGEFATHPFIVLTSNFYTALTADDKDCSTTVGPL